MKKLNLCLATAFVVVVASTAFATPDTWVGGSGNNWSTAANWQSGVAPVSGDDLFFDGNNTTANYDLANGLVFSNLTFNGTAGAFTLSTSGNGIVLTNAADASGTGSLSGGGVNDLAASGNNETVNIPLTFIAGAHFINNISGAGNLNLGGAITRNTGATLVFTNASANNINLTGSGLANDASGILGGWAIIGNDWASLSSGNVIAYVGYKSLTGAPDISSGATANDNIQISGTTGNPTDSVNTTINTIEYADAGATARTLTLSSGVILKLGGANHRAPFTELVLQAMSFLR